MTWERLATRGRGNRVASRSCRVYSFDCSRVTGDFGGAFLGFALRAGKLARFQENSPGGGVARVREVHSTCCTTLS